MRPNHPRRNNNRAEDRCRHARSDRRGRLTLFVVVLVTSCLLAGCSRGPYVALRPGQCLPDGAGVEGQRAQEPRTVDCSKPHRYQVFAVVALTPPSDEWPGEAMASANAEVLCVDAIKAATGLDPADTPDDVELLHIDPTESSWRDGDRDVECLFRWDSPTTEVLVGS